MDIRHPFKKSDLTLIEWSKETHIPLKVLLNKADKISKNKVRKEVMKGNQTLKDLSAMGEAQAFSAKSLIGLDELKESLLGWFTV